MKVTALVENHYYGEAGLLHEHGLCIYIEFQGKSYLLDTGASNKFAKNAKTMGIDLKNVDVAALSHAHYDHSGGYRSFFAANPNAKVYLQKAAREETFEKIWFVKKYIGIPRGVQEEYADRFVYVEGKTEIDKDVYTVGHTTPGLEKRGKRAHMARQTAKGLRADDFAHEQSLVFDSPAGLVIFNSCSHGGVDNVIREVKAAFPEKKVRAMIGGFHLMGLAGASTMGVKEEEVRELGKCLEALDVQDIYTCHCTGTPAFEILADTMGKKLHEFHTGDIVEF